MVLNCIAFIAFIKSWLCYFQVTDKRVSRSHAVLEVKDGKLYLTPVSKVHLLTEGI